MEKELWEQKKKFNLFISKEDVNDIIKVIKSVQNSGVLIDGVTETGKHESKKQEGGFLGALSQSLAASVVQTCNFFSGKRYYWKRSHKSRKRIL